MSAWPSAQAMWLFPAPGRPTATTLIASARKLPSRRRSICIRVAAPKRLRSRERKFFPGNNSDCCRSRSTRRADFAACSMRTSSSRKASWLSPSLAARSALSSTALAIAPNFSPRSNRSNSSRRLAMSVPRGEQRVVITQIYRRLGNRRCGGGLAATRVFAHGVEARYTARFEQLPDRQLDRGFGGARRQMQQPQVFAVRPGRHGFEQRVVGTPKVGGREQFLAVTV